MKRMALTMCAAAAALMVTGCSSYQDRIAEQALKGRQARYDDRGNLYQLYEYYPNEQVYRSVYGGTWHYQARNETWYRTATLPAGFESVQDSHSELIELPTSEPWHMHPMVVRQYPSIDALRAQAAAVQAEHYADVTEDTAYATVTPDDAE